MDINTVLNATLEGYELAKAKLAKAEQVIAQLQEKIKQLEAKTWEPAVDKDDKNKTDKTKKK